MQFKQVNKNLGGDVNNVIAEQGNAVQVTGSGNKVEVGQHKSTLWSKIKKVLAACWGWWKGTPGS
jgi:hypothetical protein